MQCREDILTREVTNPRSRDWSPSLEFNSCGGCTPPERGIKPETKRLMSPRRPGSVSCPVLQGLLDTLDYFHLFLWVHLQELLEISGMCALWISVLEIFQLVTLRMRQVATPLCQPGVRRTRCRAPSRFLFFFSLGLGPKHSGEDSCEEICLWKRSKMPKRDREGCYFAAPLSKSYKSLPCFCFSLSSPLLPGACNHVCESLACAPARHTAGPLLKPHMGRSRLQFAD